MIRSMEMQEKYKDRRDFSGEEQIKQRLGTTPGVAHPKYAAEYFYFKKEEVKLLERGIRRSIELH